MQTEIILFNTKSTLFVIIFTTRKSIRQIKIKYTSKFINQIICPTHIQNKDDNALMKMHHYITQPKQAINNKKVLSIHNDIGATS